MLGKRVTAASPDISGRRAAALSIRTDNTVPREAIEPLLAITTTDTLADQPPKAPTPHTPEPGPGGGPAPRPAPGGLAATVPGLGVVALLAAVAYALGRLVPVIGGPIFGIALGMAIAAVARPHARLRPGISFAGKQGLQIAIVALGTGLSLTQILRTGADSLPVMLGTMAICLLAAWLFGRLLKTGPELQTMIGVGTGICGASAIAAVSGVIAASEMDIAYSVSTIFLFNAIAVLLYPTLGHLMHLTQHAFGLWAGTAINDTSSVVAAADIYGAKARAYAVIVKLTRTTLIIPITLGLAAWRIRTARRAGTAGSTAGSTAGPKISWRKLIPWFILWFLLASVINTLGLFPLPVQHALAQLATFLIVMALTAIGLSAQFSQMRRTGVRPLLLGALLWATVGLSSLLLQSLTGQL